MKEESKEWKTADETRRRFHNFQNEKTFVGTYVEDYSYTPEGDTVPEWTAFVFQNEEGEQVMLGQFYQLNEAVKKYGTSVKYKITFLGSKKLEGKKTVNEFSIMVKEL